MDKHCSNCCHCSGTAYIGNYLMYNCKISSLITNGNPCSHYNEDVSDKKICYNCNHFLGENGDFGLCCALHYNKLSCCMDAACDDFNRKAV